MTRVFTAIRESAIQPKSSINFLNLDYARVEAAVDAMRGG